MGMTTRDRNPSLIAREPVAFVVMLTGLANLALPILLAVGVQTHLVEVIGVAVTGAGTTIGAFLRGAVTPNGNVALTHDQADKFIQPAITSPDPVV